MNIHEYQARALLKAAGVPMFDGDVASTPTEAEAIARRLGGTVVVKAQVHTGGRGKAGGVKLAANPAEAADVASRILGMTINGLTVHKVLVVPAADIATEAYVGLIMDRETQRPVFMVSPAGGIDIEEVAATTPEKIVRIAVDPRYGLFGHQALGLALSLYADFAQARAAAKIMQVRTQVQARPPWMPPTMDLAKSTRRVEMPPTSIRLPARIKNGTASKGNESMPLTIR